MKIADIYAKYQIMPQLQTHMLRVAGVGKQIALSWKGECDEKYVTQLCLVHDLGNIVKFDLRDNIDRAKFGEIENLKYWQEVQQDYWGKYGHDAHEATIGMLKDAKLERLIEPINEEAKLYFGEAKESELSQADLGSIILLYADCRVTPEGVTTYRERVNDLATRYGSKSKTWEKWTYWFEEWMQKQVGVDLNAIDEQSVIPMFDELLAIEI